MVDRLTQGLRILLVVIAVAFVPLYIYIACSRMGYPFDLEWLEGAAASNTLRAMNGLPIYVKPTLDYVPEVYTPLYFYLSSMPMRVIGVGFLPLRLVSFLFSLGAMALLFDMARRETGQRSLGLLAAGFYAATFGVSGAWFDLARVDSVFLFLLLGMWLVRGGRTTGASIAAGLVAALAFFTKQTALGLFLPLLLWTAWAWKKRALWFAGVCLTLTGGGFLILDTLHHGWFRYYTVTLPAMDGIRQEMLLRFWWADLLLILPAGVLAVLVYFALTISGRAGRPARDAWFFFLAGGGMVGLSWLARIHKGGYLNVLMPAYAFLALMVPLGIHAAEQALGHQGPALRKGAVRAAFFLVVIAQLLFLAVAPENGILPAGRWIPTAEDRAAGEAVVELISGLEGPVFTPFHCFLPVSAGKRYCGSRGAMMPILYGMENPRQQELVSEGILAFRRHKFDAIIMDKKRFRHFQEAIELYYREEPGELIGREDLFRTVTGMRTQPRFLYLPRPE